MQHSPHDDGVTVLGQEDRVLTIPHSGRCIASNQVKEFMLAAFQMIHSQVIVILDLMSVIDIKVNECD